MQCEKERRPRVESDSWASKYWGFLKFVVVQVSKPTAMSYFFAFISPNFLPLKGTIPAEPCFVFLLTQYDKINQT